ncbi:hypothetical protein GCM10009687_01880 [Asanoa iriomotensis]|uniref:MmgE/PrpD family protein n=1 Tax=Asanoa iriomotensis TaxID=234613 RepID=UPI0031D42C9B
MDAPLVAIAAAARTAPVDLDAARLLLADHIACAWDRSAPEASSVVALAIRGHRGDRDDIYWPARIHPGSVVWPVVLSVPSVPGRCVAAAAAAGYEAAAVTATWLGEAAARRWHTTAVAGQAGAAAAAAVLLAGRRDPEAIAAAVGLALTTAGGVGQTMRERSPAAAWHRAAAASAGLEAARAAAWGLTPPEAVLSGDAGVGALFGAAGEEPRPLAALGATSIRPYPVNGFAQSAVAALLALRSGSAALEGLEVAVAPQVAVAAGAERGWWSLAETVARVWASPDPFRLEQPGSGAPPVRIHVESRPVESARVWPSGRPDEAVEVSVPPGGPGPERQALAERKWAADADLMWTLAGAAVDDGDTTAARRALGV